MKTLQNNYTTPEQSKRLLEFGVPADSADCFYNYAGKTNTGLDLGYFKTPNILLLEGRKFTSWCNTYPDDRKPIPCWSVGRLIEISRICTTLPEEEYMFPFWYDTQDNIEWAIRVIESGIRTEHMDFSKLEE